MSLLNTFWASDAIWRWSSVSTLARVMACCLAAPSHYLNQCWLIISEVLWHFLKAISQKMLYSWYGLENCLFKMTATSPRGQWVKLTFEKFKDLTRSHQPFQLVSYPQNIFQNQWWLKEFWEKHVYYRILFSGPVKGQALLAAGASAGTAMTKFRSQAGT